MTAFTGTGALLRLALRRERVALPAWTGALALIVVGQIGTYTRLLPTAQDRQGLLAEISRNPVFLAFNGPAFAATVSGLVVWRLSATAFCLLGLMALLTVVRHTRADEEAGRYELLAAGAVGRLAPLGSALLVTAAACALAGLLCALGMGALTGEWAGAGVFGAALTLEGWVFAALAALAAQLVGEAGSARALAGAALVLAYALRFVGDGSGSSWLSWLSPLAWGQQARPFADNRWWVLLLPLAAALLAGAAAVRIAVRRDLGAGLIRSRSGPATGDGLRGPLALAWCLQRAMLLGWVAAFALLGAFFGLLAPGFPPLLGQTSPAVQEFFRRFGGADGSADLVDAFLWTIMLTLGYTAALYPALAVLRLRAEEAAGRAEIVLAGAVSRLRWAASHLLIALLGTALIMAAAGLAIGLAYGAGGGFAAQLPRLMAAALLQVPAAWVLGGVAALAVGAAPRAAVAVCWLAWLLINLFGEIVGPILGLGYWVANTISPFHYLPNTLAGDAVAPLPLAGLLGVTALLVALGLAALRRRDIG
jgi:ABC-2 type transport system permease protein